MHSYGVFYLLPSNRSMLHFHILHHPSKYRYCYVQNILVTSEEEVNSIVTIKLYYSDTVVCTLVGVWYSMRTESEKCCGLKHGNIGTRWLSW